MKVEIYTPDNCEEKMLFDLENGQEKGTTTYIDSFDQYWTWRKSEANIWTGISGEGKSEWLSFISLIKSLEEGWKFTLNSPENMPAYTALDSLIHTLSGKTTDKFNKHNELITKDLYIHCLNLIRNNFKHLYIKPPDNTVENCLEQFQKIHEKTPQDAFIMDPIMKFQKSKNAPSEDHNYATYVDTLITDFARVNNISLHLVAHQVTPRVNQTTGYFDPVSGFQIKGGSSWVDGIDNVCFVQRPFFSKDKINTYTKVGSLKIKKQKLTGIPGEIELKFNRKTNRYEDMNENNIYNFNKWLPNFSVKNIFSVTIISYL